MQRRCCWLTWRYDCVILFSPKKINVWLKCCSKSSTHHFSACRAHSTKLLRNRDKLVRNSHLLYCRLNLLIEQICALFACQLKFIILKNCVQSEDCALFSFYPCLPRSRTSNGWDLVGLHTLKRNLLCCRLIGVHVSGRKCDLNQCHNIQLY